MEQQIEESLQQNKELNFALQNEKNFSHKVTVQFEIHN